MAVWLIVLDAVDDIIGINVGRPGQEEHSLRARVAVLDMMRKLFPDSLTMTVASK